MTIGLNSTCDNNYVKKIPYNVTAEADEDFPSS